MLVADPKMARIRKDFLNPNAPKNVEKLNADLSDIHGIMVQNIQEMMRRGEKLSDIQDMSSTLLTGAMQRLSLAVYSRMHRFKEVR